MTEPTHRMLLVHAHPDDETINNGATMARYAAAGAAVTLVTCTRGELGEILVPELAHLAADAEGGLGAHRETELAAAMAALGVRDHRFLGEAGHGREARMYRDSGMAYAPDGSVIPVPDLSPDAFALADVDEAAQRLADVVREVRPQVLVTYEPGGGYGHPDHLQAHRVTMRAVELAGSAEGAGGSAWAVPKTYWIVLPETTVRRALAELTAAGENPFEGWSADGPLPSMIVPDDQVTTSVDGSAYTGHKAAAMRAHATQIIVDGPLFALSNGVGQPLVGVEYYRLVTGRPAAPFDAEGRETDLFAGV
ncbi:MAG TPA: N-acetyl-1-D-myo-inositol-2-amino-2-deoxy-alpha-D-glucopyranoside deacetylase [Kineosporiaceae bacterium]|nr:N-acetyl-1-D-myo-inositol-2-amino-2-deoxy-alpha-D-glucopyranoside deacetylase [Kineosporiaceae bacterium]